MDSPFFSVVIPTKNRPHFLGDSIQSVLRQDFEDYELIISDNYNDGATKEVVDKFINNPHVRYFRTDHEMNIPDHWEFATSKANGQYIAIITDRSLFMQGALHDIYTCIQQNGIAQTPVVFWRYGYYEEDTKKLLIEKNEPGVKIKSSRDLLQRFSRTLDDHFLPRPHVGCYHKGLAEKIRADQGRLFSAFGPDFTSSLLFLLYTDAALYIPRTIALFQGAAVSSGTKAQTSIERYLHSLKLKNPYEFVPMRVPLNLNLIFNDLLKLKNSVGKKLNDIHFDHRFYFKKMYQVYIERKILWKVSSDNDAFWAEWTRALGLFDRNFRRQVRMACLKLWFPIMKSYIRSTVLGRFLLSVKRILRGGSVRSASTALAAAGFEQE